MAVYYCLPSLRKQYNTFRLKHSLYPLCTNHIGTIIMTTVEIKREHSQKIIRSWHCSLKYHNNGEIYTKHIHCVVVGVLYHMWDRNNLVGKKSIPIYFSNFACSLITRRTNRITSSARNIIQYCVYLPLDQIPLWYLFNSNLVGKPFTCLNWKTGHAQFSETQVLWKWLMELKIWMIENHCYKSDLWQKHILLY